MRVLWLSHLVPYPPKGGVLQRSHHLLRELASCHEVDLLAFMQKGLLAPIFPSIDEGKTEASAALSDFCSRVAFVDAPTDSGKFGRHLVALESLVVGEAYTMRWMRCSRYAALVRAWSLERHYDAVLFDTISLVPYLSDLAGRPGLLLDHHNVESDMMVRRAEHERNPLAAAYFRREGRLLAQAERKYCTRFDLNITCSALDSERLESLVPGIATEVIPNGVDVSYFRPLQEVESHRRLIFVGTLSWYPNREAVEFLAHRIWPLLRARDPEVEVDIVGAGATRALEDLARSDPRFNVHGFVDDIRPMVARSALFVCPIMDGGGTKLKILDALSMGKAIVAHPVACEGIDVMAGRHVEFAESPEEWCDAIIGLLDDHPRRRAMETENRALAESNYGLERIGSAFRTSVEGVAVSAERRMATERDPRASGVH